MWESSPPFFGCCAFLWCFADTLDVVFFAGLKP